MSLRGPSSTSTPNTSQSDESDNPFLNLGLSSDQSAKIRLIVRNEKSQNLSAHELKRQIDAVLTPQQQSQLQTVLRSRQQRDQSVNEAIHGSKTTADAAGTPSSKPAAGSTVDTQA
jgi:DNA transposition AAA+ family ATPase